MRGILALIGIIIAFVLAALVYDLFINNVVLPIMEIVQTIAIWAAIIAIPLFLLGLLYQWISGTAKKKG